MIPSDPVLFFLISPPYVPSESTRERWKSSITKEKENSTISSLLILGCPCPQQFGLVLLAQADNKNLRTDIVALGISTHLGDKTPPVWHHGIDIDTALAISMILGDRKLNKTPAAVWHPPVDIVCKAPEDRNKSRVWTVQFVCFPQMCDTNIASSCKGLFPAKLFQ